LVKSLGDENNLLDVKYSKSELTQEHLKALNGAKNHITWLSLANSNVENEWLSDIGNLSNLTRLQLEKTAISDLGISALSKLEHLEVLNLYDTKVTDSCLQDLANIKSLRRVYLWKTEVTKEAIASLEEDNPDIEFILGN
jgi:Leucine-rich repeat (LRR) protein